MSDFPILSFAQANPWIEGIKAGQDMYQNLINNLYAHPMAQQTLQQAIYKTQEEAPKAKYAEPRTLADLAKTQAETPHIQAQTQELLKGAIPLEQAQASHYGVEDKYTPLKYAIEATNATRQNSRFGDAYQFSRTLQALPAEQRAAYISEHPDDYQNLLSTLGNKALQQQQASQQTLLNNMVNKYYPGMMEGGNSPSLQDTMTNQGPVVGTAAGLPMDQAQLNKFNQVSPTLGNVQQMTQPPSMAEQGWRQALALNAGHEVPALQIPQPIQQQNAPEQQQPQPQDFSNSPEQAEQTKLAFQLAADRKLVGAQQSRRADAAITLEKWLSDNRAEYAPMIENASKFAGLLGKGQSLSDAISQTSPKAYTDYIKFKTQFVPNIANQMRMQESMGATDQQTKILDNMYQAGLNIDQNPEGAKRLINDSIKMSLAIGDSSIQAAEPLHKDIRRKMFKVDKMEGNYTDFEDKVKVQDPTGKTHEILRSRLNDAFKKYPDLKLVK